MAIPDMHSQNFQTLIRAASANHLALVQCKNETTGEAECVLCAVNQHKGEVDLLPLAKMFTSNPFDEVVPDFPADMEVEVVEVPLPPELRPEGNPPSGE